MSPSDAHAGPRSSRGAEQRPPRRPGPPVLRARSVLTCPPHYPGESPGLRRLKIRARRPSPLCGRVGTRDIVSRPAQGSLSLGPPACQPSLGRQLSGRLHGDPLPCARSYGGVPSTPPAGLSPARTRRLARRTTKSRLRGLQASAQPTSWRAHPASRQPRRTAWVRVRADPQDCHSERSPLRRNCGVTKAGRAPEESSRGRPGPSPEHRSCGSIESRYAACATAVHAVCSRRAVDLGVWNHAHLHDRRAAASASSSLPRPGLVAASARFLGPAGIRVKAGPVRPGLGMTSSFS